jgi:hypothetical protein
VRTIAKACCEAYVQSLSPSEGEASVADAPAPEGGAA